MCHRSDDEEGDEQADAAIGDESTGKHHCQHRAFGAEAFGHKIGDGCYGAAVFHQLAEQGAEEKDREELHDEACGASHEGLRPMGEQWLAGQSRREDGGGGREKQNAPAAIGEPDQKTERDKNAQKSHASDLFQQGVDIEG